MSFERLLVPGSTDLPDWECGTEMSAHRRELGGSARDTEIRIYRCASCQHELRLTVWIEPAEVAT